MEVGSSQGASLGQLHENEVTDLNFITIATIIDTIHGRELKLAKLTPWLATEEGYVVLHQFDDIMGIYYESLPYYNFPCTQIIFTRMKFVIGSYGGMILLSPSLQELQTIDLSNDSNTNIKELSAHNLKNYIGGDNDIYPPIARSITHAIWYMGWQYFPVSPHIHYVQGI
jgi:hypothetical protein